MAFSQFILLPLSFDERYPINTALPADQPIPLFIDVQSAIEILAGGQDKCAAVLVEALHHPDWKVRNAAAARLWCMSPWPDTAIPTLANCLHDTNEVVRLSAAVSLERSPAHRSQVITNLLAAVSSQTLSPALRRHAVRWLEHCNLRSADSSQAAATLSAAAHEPAD